MAKAKGHRDHARMTLVDKRVNEARNRAQMNLKNTNHFAI